jgi:hypothetical protein
MEDRRGRRSGKRGREERIVFNRQIQFCLTYFYGSIESPCNSILPEEVLL